ncbi:MAG: hypothetical protein DRP08_04245 [Candidatus Aenigmatarchaeota archaeon]|nr:MAG: hypothetical protein DRP08_04245 [Candidatus Aenigmarchaeota archaeon]
MPIKIDCEIEKDWISKNPETCFLIYDTSLDPPFRYFSLKLGAIQTKKDVKYNISSKIVFFPEPLLSWNGIVGKLIYSEPERASKPAAKALKKFRKRCADKYNITGNDRLFEIEKDGYRFSAQAVAEYSNGSDSSPTVDAIVQAISDASNKKSSGKPVIALSTYKPKCIDNIEKDMKIFTELLEDIINSNYNHGEIIKIPAYHLKVPRESRSMYG